MTKQKKDLTRIEDMGDFLHEEDASDDGFSTLAAESPPELPDLPVESGSETEAESESDPFSQFADDDTADAEDTAEASSEEGPSFESEGKDEGASEFSSDDFASFDSPEFGENDFSAAPLEETEVLSTDFSTEEFASSEAPQTFETETEEERPRTETISLVPQLPKAPPILDVEPDLLAEPQPRISPDDIPYRPREDFAEVRSFVEHAVLADVMAESNPAYSVRAQGIRFLEDSDDILMILGELKFSQEMMQQFRRQIERGSLLIPRISEFTAIYLTHKLRRFRLDLRMELSDVMHSPRDKDEAGKGLVSRRSLGQNQHHHFQFKEDMDETRAILLSTLSQLDGHVIERYLGVASEHAFLDSDQVEIDVPEAINSSYDELAQRLKGHALEHKANAVVGINYQLTPMPSDNPSLGHLRYKLTCTGNLVWVSKLSV